MDFFLKIAGLSFHIINWELPLSSTLEAYKSDEPAADAIPVNVTKEGIAAELAEAAASGEELSHSDGAFLCVMRQIARASLKRSRMFIHGAGISYRERGFLFTAPSGTGKTTHIQLWRHYLGDDVQFINGDKPVLIFGDQVSMGGSPWAGKEGYQQNKTVPLEALVILKRGKINAMRRISPRMALVPLYGQIFLLHETEAAISILKYLDQLLTQVPVYEFQCTMGEDALRCSFEILTNQKYEANHVITGKGR